MAKHTSLSAVKIHDHWTPASTIPPMSGIKSGFGGECSIPVLGLFPNEDDEPSPFVALVIYIRYDDSYSTDGWHTFITKTTFDRCTSHGCSTPIAWLILPDHSHLVA